MEQIKLQPGNEWISVSTKEHDERDTGSSSDVKPFDFNDGEYVATNLIEKLESDADYLHTANSIINTNILGSSQNITENKNLIDEFEDKCLKTWCKENFENPSSHGFVKVENDEDLVPIIKYEKVSSDQDENNHQVKKEERNIETFDTLIAKCTNNLDKEETTEDHSKCEQSNKNKHNCHLCNFSTLQKSKLKRHINGVHLKLKNHKCDLCDYSTAQKFNLKYHVNAVHQQLENYKCDLCEYSAFYKFSLQRHIKSAHLKIKDHKCATCDFSAFDKYKLTLHINGVHKKLKTYRCHVCDFSSAKKSNLKCHIKAIHYQIKNNQCNLCDFETSWGGDLKRHIDAVHLKLKNYECEFCDYTTYWKHNLKVHLNTAHNKSYD